MKKLDIKKLFFICYLLTMHSITLSGYKMHIIIDNYRLFCKYPLSAQCKAIKESFKYVGRVVSICEK